MRESVITKRTNNMLKKIENIWFYKASDRYTSGIPDFIICFEGKFYGIELKKTGEKPRKLQDHVISKIEKSGGTVLVADRIQQVEKFIFSTFYSSSPSSSYTPV